MSNKCEPLFNSVYIQSTDCALNVYQNQNQNFRQKTAKSYLEIKRLWKGFSLIRQFSIWLCCNTLHIVSGDTCTVSVVKWVQELRKKAITTGTPLLVQTIHTGSHMLTTLSFHIRSGATWSSLDFLSCCCQNRVTQVKYLQ